VLARVQELPMWKPFETRPFRLLWAGAKLSLLADQAFLVALTWLVLQIAGPGAGLGLCSRWPPCRGRSWRRSER
jgi:hypothetical protein